MDWRYPAYGERSFDLLPGTVERLLSGTTDRPSLALPEIDGSTFERVVLVYFDAFGWQLAERHGDHPLLSRGTLVQLTSQFPSTTAAHVTTIHGGLPVAAHGVYEWFVYEPRVNRMIAPLLFSYAGDEERGTLELAAHDVFPARTLYDDLAAAGIRSFVTQSASHATTPPSLALASGASLHAYRDPADGLAALRDAMAEHDYGLVYLGEVDHLMHFVGPDAQEAVAATEAMLTLLDGAFFGGGWPSGTLVLLTADHGMAAIDPRTSVYVNRAWPELERHLLRGADGKPLAPGGSARDLFLHVRDESVAEVVGRLGELLAGKAEVRAVAELLAEGLFGPDPSPALRDRLASVVVLPYSGESTWWYERGRFEQTFHGQHGGLTPVEMEIPLLAAVT